jgi:polysaccharide biosynthesis protein PslH
MKLLWIKTDFLHPTTRGGQIRTLEMLRRLHRRHEVHYLTLDDGLQPEGPARASEYCRHFESVPHQAPAKRSLAFAGQLAAGLFSSLPVAVSRWRSEAMRRRGVEMCRREKYDAVVCDFLFPAPNVPGLERAVLFQHNVEAMIWRRHAEHGATPFHRAYFRLQARRMEEYERLVCRTVRRVVAVSANDARAMEREYGIADVGDVPTGVDVDFFAPPETAEEKADLIFLGSMDWMPNIDGAIWFTSEVLPLLRRRHPDCSVALVGRQPSAAVTALAGKDAMRSQLLRQRICVTGTVPDVRPWLHGSKVSIVPLRVGGGTRLKIYEAMAAGIPVVSTTIGAEGLDVADGETIRLADSAAAFADACAELLDNAPARRRMAAAARTMVAERYSWEAVTDVFERYLWAQEVKAHRP